MPLAGMLSLQSAQKVYTGWGDAEIFKLMGQTDDKASD